MASILFNRERPIGYSVRPLMRRGLVAAQPDEEDRRAKLLHLTQAGFDTLCRFGVDDQVMAMAARALSNETRPANRLAALQPQV